MNRKKFGGWMVREGIFTMGAAPIVFRLLSSECTGG